MTEPDDKLGEVKAILQRLQRVPTDRGKPGSDGLAQLKSSVVPLPTKSAVDEARMARQELELAVSDKDAKRKNGPRSVTDPQDAASEGTTGTETPRPAETLSVGRKSGLNSEVPDEAGTASGGTRGKTMVFVVSAAGVAAVAVIATVGVQYELLDELLDRWRGTKVEQAAVRLSDEASTQSAGKAADRKTPLQPE
ncbi:MAG: hypothetical protein ACREC6_10445, partial [Hyphomicrobiaceae bacterium]